MLKKPYRFFGMAFGLFLSLPFNLFAQGNPAQVDTSPTSQTIGAGGTGQFTVSASGDPTLLYQWTFNGTNIATGTSSILTLNNVQATNQGSYQVVVTNDFGSATSSVAVLTVRLTPAVTGWTHTGTVAAGTTASFTVFATGQAPLAYQWSFNTVPISGATSSTLNITNAQSTNAGSYKVVITNSLSSANGPILTLNVTQQPVITGTSSTTPAPQGTTATLTAFVAGATPFTFQWYQSTTNSSNAVPNGTNFNLVITNVQTTDAGSYQVFVTNSFGSTQSAFLPLDVIPGQLPIIGGNPLSQTVPQTYTAVFQVFASGSQPIAYQWYFNNTAIPNATNQSLSVVNLQATNAGSYQVVLTNLFGVTPSAVATLTTPLLVTQAPFVTIAPLFSFDAATSGSAPLSALLKGSDGNLYVTASAGGVNDTNTGGDGTVTKMDTNGTVAWTTSLSQATGAHPAAALAEGADGNFYGTAVDGGAGFGTVFRVTSGGAVSVLYAFTNGMDGANPKAALVAASDGYLYGTTSQGGVHDVGTGGDGTVFKMTTNGVLVWSTSFNGNNGRDPLAGLLVAADGNLYGTTSSGGTNALGSGGGGTVFQLTTNGVITSLYSFAADANGAYPKAGLATGPDGNFYGTTTSGGNLSLNSGLGFGTVFHISPAGALTTLTAFNGTNGFSPQGALVLGADLNFYGVTARGGIDYPVGYGTIFVVNINGGLTNLLSFNGNYNGAYPNRGLIQVDPDVFYGTTMQGGSNNLATGGDGTVFRFTTPPPPTPPVFVFVADETLNPGDVASITNRAFTTHPPIHYHLASGAPAGSALSETGVFTWSPTCLQGSSSNSIAILAIDSNIPAQSNTITFTITVADCVQLSVGSATVQIGTSGCVPLNLVSSIGLTNLNFSLVAAANRFANWSVTSGNAALASAIVTDPNPARPQFNLTTQPGQSLVGTTALGTLCVDTLNGGGTAFIPLLATNIAATTTNSTLVTGLMLQPGLLILADGQPFVFEIQKSSNTTAVLNLYGNLGSNYTIVTTTNLSPPITWDFLTNFTLTNLLQTVPTGPTTNPAAFFKAYLP